MITSKMHPHTPTEGKLYIYEEGQWFLIFTIIQYAVYIVNKVAQIILTNSLEAEYEEKKAQVINKI
jgi:hypothetical protein